MSATDAWQKEIEAAVQARVTGNVKSAGYHYAEATALAWQAGPAAMDATLAGMVDAVHTWIVEEDGTEGLIALGKRLLVVLERVPDAIVHPELRFRRGEVQTLAYAIGLLGLIRNGDQPEEESARLRPMALANADTFDQLTDNRWQLRQQVASAFRSRYGDAEE